MFNRKHLLGLRDLEAAEILTILETAESLKKLIDRPETRGNMLEKAGIVTLFYENSTRTKMSFLMAGEYLGAKITDLAIGTSSVNKGESLADSGKNLAAMGFNIMIIRHQMTGAPHLLAKAVESSVACPVGIINGGDGTNEHPTQGLLDLLTMKERFGSFKGLKVAIIGDTNNSRVARSNVFGLKTLGADVTLAGPSTMISKGMEVLGAKVTTDLREAVTDADVVMGLRIQMERQKAAPFPDLREYSQLFGIREDLLSLAKKDALIMHPGPINRGVELDAHMIDHSQSVIYEQAKNGVAVRMALLMLISKNLGLEVCYAD